MFHLFLSESARLVCAPETKNRQKHALLDILNYSDDLTVTFPKWMPFEREALFVNGTSLRTWQRNLLHVLLFRPQKQTEKYQKSM